ncbi:hypothetical protein [uncultured Helicobacter sp.]|nr:hypothetical protein [uncultured Helicobacter sp.]
MLAIEGLSRHILSASEESSQVILYKTNHSVILRLCKSRRIQ